MAEVSLLWDAGGGGDESPHSEALTAALFGALAGVGAADEGVLAHVGGELAPSSIAGDTQVRVAPGWAVVDGHPYWNDANKDTTPATPAVGTTGRRMVLRANWGAQTVRLVEISSADGTAAIPALTQTSGTTYEIPLCSYTVTTGGAIVGLVDERAFAGPSGVDVQTFDTSGTWTKPPGVKATSITVLRLYGAGGGGGGGRGGAGSTGRLGGIGAGGGQYDERIFRTADLDDSEVVTIGAGGTGGAGTTSGTDGGHSSFKAVTAYGGKKGLLGPTSGTVNGGNGGGPAGVVGSSAPGAGRMYGNTSFGAGTRGDMSGGAGGGVNGGTAGFAGGDSEAGGAGGGSGGGADTGNNMGNGGVGGGPGGGSAGTAHGTAPTAGGAGTGRGGGGGGGGSNGVNGPNGGAGGPLGGGGGGGGGGTSVGGTGGNGGDGYAELITIL